MTGRIITHASLFSGIGGFDLAAAWMGWDNVFNCEIEPFCRTVLRHYFPHAIGYVNIKETDFRRHRGEVDVLSGGFPCQPFSIAGKRLGKADERHLWPDMLRAIREIRPRWVVGENVRGLLSWNEGLVFEEVHADLEAANYQVQAFVIPAAGINAPHQRQRVWFIAHAAGLGGGARNGPQPHPSEWKGAEHFAERVKMRNQDPAAGGTRPAADSDQLRCGAGCSSGSRGQLHANRRTSAKNEPEWKVRKRWPGEAGAAASYTGRFGCKRTTAFGSPPGQEPPGRPRKGFPAGKGWGKTWQNFPQTEPTVCCGDDGLPGPVDLAAFFEGLSSPVISLPFGRWRTESIKALGNAIVPQIAYRIFKTIEAMKLH